VASSGAGWVTKWARAVGGKGRVNFLYSYTSALYSKNIDFFRASRMDEYLHIMSIYQTCEYKKVSFLKFLLSKETDMDEYCRKM